MKKESTKERILTEAVKLFAKNGYEAVTVEQIALAVGIKAPSLYKHYKSKKDIFRSILLRMEQMDYDGAEAYGMPEGTLGEMPDKYEQTQLEQICRYTEAQFRYWTEDEFASAFRQMLTVEQFRNKEMSDLCSQYLGTGPMEYMQDIFTQMTGSSDAGAQLALEFYAPMYMLYSLYDAQPQDKKNKAAAMLHSHLEEFSERFAADHK